MAKIKVFLRAADSPWNPAAMPLPKDWKLDWFIPVCTMPMCEFIHSDDPKLLAEEIVATMVGFDIPNYRGRNFSVGDMYVLYRDGVEPPEGRFPYVFVDRVCETRIAAYTSYGWDCVRSLRFQDHVLVFIYDPQDPREERVTAPV